MKKNYYYRVYGLNIKSDIKIDEFAEIEKNDNIDINVKYDEPPEELIHRFTGECSYFKAKDKFVFDIGGIGTYCIFNGNLITYKPYQNADSYYVKIFITCSCMGAVMIQRNKLAIHGGTVEMNNKAVIVTGDKGAGKSSLTIGLRKKGYKFISDDIAAIDFKDNQIVVNPGAPFQKLCEDAAINMGYNIKDYFSFMSDEQIKYVIPAEEDYKKSDTELGAIFEIEKGDVSEVIIQEITSSNKLGKIIDNLYRREFLEDLGGMKPELFKKCVMLSKGIKYYKITRPLNGFTVDRQIQLIEQKMFQGAVALGG